MQSPYEIKIFLLLMGIGTGFVGIKFFWKSLKDMSVGRFSISNLVHDTVMLFAAILSLGENGIFRVKQNLPEPMGKRIIGNFHTLSNLIVSTWFILMAIFMLWASFN